MGQEQVTGKVYLVGAGPGDPDLITRRGYELLQQCDVVVYDNLIAPELVCNLPDRVETVYVGKQKGRHTLPQAEINELLVKFARAGKEVVRLKGGDPFIFGRGGEEALHLVKNKVSYEVVPGVTAGVAAPAYAGIPATQRDLACNVTFVTGHQSAQPGEGTVHWDKLARLENGTLIGYMGVGQLPHIVEQLIKGGMSAKTPAGLVERGTFGVQKTVTSTLAELPVAAETAGIQPPAVFIIGEVVLLRDQLKWFDQLPLFGRRVMVLRPLEQAIEVYRNLRRLGAEVVPAPTLHIAADFDRRGWARLQSLAKPGDWLYFASENGVNHFFRQWRQQGRDLRGLSIFSIAVVGRGALRALEPTGIHADLIAATPTTIGLAEEMAARLDLSGRCVIRVRGNLGDEAPDEILRRGGADVQSLVVYRTNTAKWSTQQLDQLYRYPPHFILISSGASITALIKILGKERALQLAAEATTISIGPSTSRVARELGIEPTLEAAKPSLEGLLETLQASINNH